MKNIKACLSHNTDDWKTPTKIYNYFVKQLGFIDCFKYQSKENQLDKNYRRRNLFINPPFSKMKEITPWIIKQIKHHNFICLLIPARTDTKYFHDLLMYKPTIFFIKGRLHYNDSKSAPFPTLLLIFENIKYSYPTYYSVEQKDMEYEPKTND